MSVPFWRSWPLSMPRRTPEHSALRRVKAGMTRSETILISAVSIVLAAIGTVFIMSGVQAVFGV